MILLCLIAVVLAPFLYETTIHYVASWRTILGTPTRAETPLLDLIATFFGDARYEVGRWVSGNLSHRRWTPTYVLTAAALVTGVGMLFLRKN